MKIEQRVWAFADGDLQYYREWIKAAVRYPGSCDAVWLVIPPGALKMSDHEKYIAALKPIAAELRAAGIGVSLQCGSLGADCSVLYGKDLYRDIFPGDITMTLYCWRNERVRGYFAGVLELYARELRPDAVWPDDDMGIRIWGQPPRCMCPSCLEKFNKKYGCSFDADGLTKEMETDLAVRERFVEFSYEGLAEYAEILARAVYKGHPDAVMGQQHGDYNGQSPLRALDAYMRAGGKEAYSRSGAGAYSDRAPMELLAKARALEWQLARLPEYVTRRCPEVENFPHVYYSKSAYGTCLESTLYLAQGFNFLSYSAIPRRQENRFFRDGLFRELSRHRKYWERLEEGGRGAVRAGAQIYVPKNYWNAIRADWYNVMPNAAMPYSNIGLPATYQEQTDPAYILDGRLAECLSEDEIRYLASRPVLTDAETLEVLSARGFGGLLNASAEPYGKDISAFEGIPGVLFTEHPVNAGLTVRCYGGMFGERAFRITGDAEPLSVYGARGLLGCTAAAETERRAVADAIVNTALGGKWAVFGYVPWSENLSFERRGQIFNAYAYIGGKCAAFIAEPNRVEIFPRIDRDGKTANVTLLNASIEKTGALTLQIERPAGDKFVYMDAGREIELKSGTGNGRAFVKLPKMGGWSAGTVFVSTGV
ncbi:MAG: hypothetical protein LBL66_05450 [Clostridiales bacterium]|jgi:hypothetical protein|nr:hypothetical protein [Clostridiales bacterium]